MIVWLEHDPESGFRISLEKRLGTQRADIPKAQLARIQNAFAAFEAAQRELAQYWDYKKDERNFNRRAHRDLKRAAKNA